MLKATGCIELPLVGRRLHLYRFTVAELACIKSNIFGICMQDKPVHVFHFQILPLKCSSTVSFFYFFVYIFLCNIPNLRLGASDLLGVTQKEKHLIGYSCISCSEGKYLDRSPNNTTGNAKHRNSRACS